MILGNILHIYITHVTRALSNIFHFNFIRRNKNKDNLKKRNICTKQYKLLRRLNNKE